MPEFDQIQIGQSEEITHVISSEDITNFAKLSGDFNPIHISNEYALNTPYKKPIAHGMLSASFISQMIGYKLPGPGSLWISQSLDFHMPAFVGDTLTIKAKVEQVSKVTRIIKLEIAITNQNNTILVTGKSTVKMIEQKKERSSNMSPKSIRTVFITGGSGEIGSSVATKLAEAGHNVIINYNLNSRSANQVAKKLTAKGANVITLKGDISSIANLKAIANKLKKQNFPKITDLVHCASPMPNAVPFESLDWDDFQKQIDVQIKGAFVCAKLFAPEIIEQGGGAFIMIGSVYAENQTATSLAHYITAKAGMSGLCRCIAKELGPVGIRANVIAPGMVDTKMLSAVPEKTKLLTKMNTPLRKIANVDDVANMVEFLIGQGGTHITGQTINICGGLTI